MRHRQFESAACLEPVAEAVRDGTAPPPIWPALGELGLTATALQARRTGLGGSDANVIFGGDSARLLALWEEKRGGASASLADVLPVMLGHWTEAFNRHWYEQMTRFAVSEAGLVAVSETHRWRRATLDGFVEAKSSVWEAKHVSAFAKPEEVLARYMPQLQHNMAVIAVDSAVLSVIYGNHKWEAYEVASDWLYQDELLAAEQRFWNCVCSGERPVPVEPPAPPRTVGTREVCLEGNNAWAAAAADWLAHSGAARKHATAVKELKELVEEDVTRAYGHGLEARRSKAGALTIREAR